MKLEVSIKKKLRDFNLEVDFTVQDKVFALLGASGCGKSMTLKCIAGIETPDSGKIILNDRILYDSAEKINLPPQKRRAGYLFQNYALFPNMTVEQNILLAAVGTKEEKKLKLQENLKRFQLEGLEKAYPRELSGGQQQRVSFARVLTSHAEILLLDEPFSALDSWLRWQLESELAEIFKIYGAAILVSHDRGEVYRLADKIGVMHNGKINFAADKREVFKKPKTLSAAILTGCKNISPARKIEENLILAEDWQLELRLEEKISDAIKFIGIRAHDLEYQPGVGENTFDLKVEQEIEDIFSYIIMLKGAGKALRWEIDKEKWQRLRSDRLKVRIPPEKIVLVEGE